MTSGALGVLTSVALSPIALGLHVALVRATGRADSAVRAMFVSLIIYGAAWAALFYVVDGRAPGFVSGLSMAGFLGLGYAEAFSMVCRGFSLRIMVDVYMGGSLSTEEIAAKYGGGMGLTGLVAKRAYSMKSLGLVKFDGENIKCTAKGRSVGRMGLFVKSVLKMGAGG